MNPNEKPLTARDLNSVAVKSPIDKAAAFLTARSHSTALNSFYVRVERGMGGYIAEAVLFSKDKETSYARVTVTEEVRPEKSGPGYRVRVSYPAQNDTHTNLRHTYLAAATAACDLAEAVDAHLRSGL